MTKPWSLAQLLASLHDDIEHQLDSARRSIAHAGTKGDASESVWLDLFDRYLPARYHATRAHIVDSKGKFSDQIDIVVRDRQYSPFIFHFNQQEIVPAESVYAVFEVKQTVDSDLVRYAQDKAASVRRLHRTSLPIPHAGGTYPAKVPPRILAGLLALESEWKPPLGDSFERALSTGDEQRRLDLGCVAAHGTFTVDSDGICTLVSGMRPATAFLLELIAQLQFMATVPMIDVRAYAEWLDK